MGIGIPMAFPAVGAVCSGSVGFRVLGLVGTRMAPRLRSIFHVTVCLNRPVRTRMPDGVGSVPGNGRPARLV